MTDGDFAKLDGLYFFANASAANARVNVIAPGTHNLTEHGTCTFTVNQGITGDGSTCYEDTGFNPSTAGGHWVLNGASLGACVLNNRTAGASAVPIGVSDGSSFSMIEPLDTSNRYQIDINEAGFGVIAGSTTSQGSAIGTRTGAAGATVVYYRNGVALGSAGNGASTTIANANIFILAFSNLLAANQLSTDQVGYAFYGGALDAAAALRIYNRLHTMMQALGASAC